MVIKSLSALEDRFNAMLPHDDMMIPHWQKLANGVSGRHKVEDMQFYRISLPISVLDIMFPSFHLIKKLRLYTTGLGNDGIMKLSSFIKG